MRRRPGPPQHPPSAMYPRTRRGQRLRRRRHHPRRRHPRPTQRRPRRGPLSMSFERQLVSRNLVRELVPAPAQRSEAAVGADARNAFAMRGRECASEPASSAFSQRATGIVGSAAGVRDRSPRPGRRTDIPMSLVHRSSLTPNALDCLHHQGSAPALGIGGITSACTTACAAQRGSDGRQSPPAVRRRCAPASRTSR